VSGGAVLGRWSLAVSWFACLGDARQNLTACEQSGPNFLITGFPNPCHAKQRDAVSVGLLSRDAAIFLSCFPKTSCALRQTI